MTVHALSIAGSDPSGGAGIQADLKTFSALGAYGMAAVTALTAQNTHGVSGVFPVPAEFVTAQLEALLDDIRIDAIKIGMLPDAAVIEAVVTFLSRCDVRCIVLDPVMVATSGDRLLDGDATAALDQLLPLASIVTPNLAEAAVLTGSAPATDLAGMVRQAQLLGDRGARRVYLKGGHLTDAAGTDVLWDKGRHSVLPGDWVDTRHTHGTGCSLSSALAAVRPQRADWSAAARDAKDWLTEAIRRAGDLDVGSGRGPVHHFHAWW